MLIDLKISKRKRRTLVPGIRRESGAGEGAAL